MLGIRNGMGPESRRALREKWALKLGLLHVFHSCDTHDCDDHGNRGGGSGAPDWMSESQKRIYDKLRGPVQADYLAKERAAYKKKHGKLPPKAGAKPRAVKPKAVPVPAGLMDKRKQNIVVKKKWFMFPKEVGDLVGKEIGIRQKTERVWLSRSEFLALRGPGGETALERYAARDLHGMVVERGGKYMDPFSTGHTAARLEQFDMAGDLDSGALVKRLGRESAFSVELKSMEPMPSGAPRQKNRIYLMEPVGGGGGKQTALNVVVKGSDIQTAIVEFADGSFADLRAVRRALASSGRTLTNNVISVEEFERAGAR